jgi:hypothetical protein
MRLTRYLIESDYAAEDLFVDIKKKCKPYLSLLKGKEPLFRGLHDISDSKATFNDEEDVLVNKTDVGLGYGIKKVRKNRTPKGTNKKDFLLVNKWLDSHGHARRDQSISVTADKIQADYFGANSWVFPIGKFDYSWVKSPDFNHSCNTTGYVPGDVFHYLRKFYAGTLDTESKQGNLDFFITTNKGFEEAYKKDYEIWIDCKEYYYVLVRNKDGFKYEWKQLAGFLK